MPYALTIGGEAFAQPDVIAGWSLFKKLGRVVKKATRLAKKVSPLHMLGVPKLASKLVRPLLKTAAPMLGTASVAFPWLAPAAVAAKLASNVMRQAGRGKKAARAAMRLLGRSADRGSQNARRTMAIMRRLAARRAAPRAQQALPRGMTPGLLRQLAAMARRGHVRAAGTLRTIAGAAERGDVGCQHLLEQAAGTSRWNDGSFDGYHATAGAHATAGSWEVASGQDWEIVGQDRMGPVDDYGSYYDVVAGGPVWNAVKPQTPYRSDESPTYWGARDAYYDGLRAVPARG